MADTDPKIMAQVEAALKENPDASVEDLFKMAKKSSRGVGRLNLRQFHARYPLQIKRRAGAGAKKAGVKKPKAAAAPRRAASKAASRVRQAVRRGRPPGSRNGPKVEERVGRDGVKAAFLDFAADLTTAEGRKGQFTVVANVDQYVDAAIKALG